MTATPARVWAAALEELARHMTRDYSPATIDRVAKHVRRFASASQVGPWDVTPTHVTDWLDAQQVTASGRYTYRSSLRTFYRWALTTGRVLADPTEGPGSHDHLRKPAPTAWEDALRAYVRYLRAAGQSRDTVTLRTEQLRRLGREIGADPWDVDAGDLIDWMATHTWAPSRARNVRSAVRGFYRWGQQLGHCDDNPADALPIIRQPLPVPRPAGEDAYAAALANADTRARLMLRLSAELGMRRAEVAHASTADLHTDHLGAWLWVTGKGGKTRRLPVPADLAHTIAACPPGYLFPGRSGHLTPQRVGILVRDLLPPGVTMHQLRHRFATNAYQRTRDLFALQQVLGHANPATTRQYVRTDDTALRALVEDSHA